MTRRLPLAALLAALLFAPACQPFVMLPGGRLSGEPAPTPRSWAFSDSTQTMQLETRPSDPYSVNVWGVAIDDALYVGAGRGEDSRWARNLIEDPAVRLRIEERVYELNAVRVEDPTEIAAWVQAVQKKYDYKPEPEQALTGWLFRLDPRP